MIALMEEEEEPGGEKMGWREPATWDSPSLFVLRCVVLEDGDWTESLVRADSCAFLHRVLGMGEGRGSAWTVNESILQVVWGKRACQSADLFFCTLLLMVKAHTLFSRLAFSPKGPCM